MRSAPSHRHAARRPARHAHRAQARQPAPRDPRTAGSNACRERYPSARLRDSIPRFVHTLLTGAVKRSFPFSNVIKRIQMGLGAGVLSRGGWVLSALAGLSVVLLAPT